MSSGKGWRKAMRGQLRQLHGDCCCWCGEPMVFDYEFANGPRFATIEHTLPVGHPERNMTDRLRLAHKACNHRAGPPPHAPMLKQRPKA